MIAENADGRKRNRPQRVKAASNLRKEGDSRKVPVTPDQQLLLSRSVKYQATLAENVRILRTWAGISQAALAERLGWYRTTIIRIETGETCPSFAQACILAEVFNVTVDALSKDLSWMYSMNNAGSLPEALRNARLAANMTQDAAAKKCGLTRNEYQAIESGKVPADADTMAKLSRAFSRPIVFAEAG